MPRTMRLTSPIDARADAGALQPRKRRVGAGLVTLALAGALGLLIMTRWGIGTSPDSIQYIRAARALMGDAAATSDAGGSLLTHHAPFYPLLLASLGRLGVDPLDGARWLNAALFGLNIFIVGLLVRRTSHHTRWLWLVAAALMLGSIPVLTIHASALTEPLFLLLTLAGFSFLARYLDGAGRGLLMCAALTLGLAFLARYAGLAGIIAGSLSALLFGARPPRRRLADALLLGMVGGLPMAGWMLRNLAVASTATGREMFVHPIGTAHVWQAIYTASGWLLIPASAPDVVRLSVWALLAIAGAALLARRRRAMPDIPQIVRVLSLFAPVYCLFLAVSISLFDANTPLDDRILLPVFAAGLIVVLYAVDFIWPFLGGKPALTATVVVTLAAFTVAHLIAGTAVAATSYTSGWGFTSRSWQQSPTLAGVRALPVRMTVYSNAPEIVYLHSGRMARSLPRTRSLMNGETNRDFAAELAALDEALGEECGVIVYFRALHGQKSMPSEDELTSALSLSAIAESADGTILGAAACQP